MKGQLNKPENLCKAAEFTAVESPALGPATEADGKSKDLSSILRTHGMGWRDNSCRLFSDLHTHAHTNKQMKLIIRYYCCRKIFSGIKARSRTRHGGTHF